MTSLFPSTRTANTIPADPTNVQPLETGDIFNHPNGIQYVYNEPPGGGTEFQDYWRAVRFFISNDYVLRTGDTMLGPLVLVDDPLSANEAATKNYVDGVNDTIIPFIIALG